MEEKRKSLPWIQKLGQMLSKSQPKESIDLICDVSTADLFLSDEEKLAAEKRDKISLTLFSDRKNYFVKNQCDGKIYFVKQNSNINLSTREWFINQKLRESDPPPQLILAKFFFISHEDLEETQQAGYLVFDFIPCCDLKKLIERRDPNITVSFESMIPKLTDKELLQGLYNILGIYARFQKSWGNMKFIHNDMTRHQIVYGLFDKKWYLLDYGNSSITYKSEIKVEQETFEVRIILPGEPEERRTLEEEIEEIYEIFIQDLENSELRDEVGKTCDIKSGPTFSKCKLARLLDSYHFPDHKE